MKVTLEFNLPEEKDGFDSAMSANKYYMFIWAFSQYLRKQTKYADDNVSEDYLKAMEDCREEFIRMMNEQKIELL